jgi:hypothetical protein
MPGVLHLVAYGATGLAFCFVVLSLGNLLLKYDGITLNKTREK